MKQFFINSFTKNHERGATLIIASSSIGLGTLALPMTGALIGIPLSIALIVILWAIVYYAALITLEVYSTFRPPYSIGRAIMIYWNKPLGILIHLLLIMLHYQLLAVYMDATTLTLRAIYPDLTSYFIPILFTLVLGGCITLGKKWVDATNRVFFSVDILFFVFIILLLLPSLFTSQVPFGQTHPPIFSFSSLFLVIPVFLGVLNLDVTLPSLAEYTSYKKLAHAIFKGSFFAILLYIVWVSITLIIWDHPAFPNDVQDFTKTLAYAYSIPQLHYLIIIFAIFCFLTSYLDIGLGCIDLLGMWVPNHSLRSLLTFIPPLILSSIYPNSFLMRLTFLGLTAALSAVILPASVALWARKKGIKAKYKAPGKPVFLIFIILVGISFLVIEIINIAIELIK